MKNFFISIVAWAIRPAINKIILENEVREKNDFKDYWRKMVSGQSE